MLKQFKNITPAASTFAVCLIALSENNNNNNNDRLAILRESLKPYRGEKEKEIREIWERDEAEGFRKLPARAWPAYQPDQEDIPTILNNLKRQNCTNDDDNENILIKKPHLDVCIKATFDLATALVFNNLDVTKGLKLFKNLADVSNNPDGMCAFAVVYLEGYGVELNEKLAMKYLKLAIEKHNHSQALYELGTCYYTGIEGILEENETLAFEMFEKAAEQNHVAAKYMCADMLLEGIGVTIDIPRAIPLLYSAADQGHRYSRQRMRELLDECRNV